MRYLSAVGVGVIAAFVTAIAWIAIRFVLPVGVPFLIARLGPNNSGVGAASASIGSGSILLAAVIGFAGGVAWMLWRR